MILDIDTCAAEARTLHPTSDGWFAILQKFKKESGESTKSVKQSMHHMASLDNVVRAVGSMPDTYLSQASFMCAKRRVTTFKSVNCAFVDIDCYSDKPNSPNIVPDKNFVDLLRANARAAGLPEPSYITFSGRGVYCKWVFDRPISAHQLLRWQALQNVLTPLYTAFGVDAGARDAARVLRVMGSSHAEAGNIVRVALNTNVVHNFDALCRAAEQVDTAKLVWPANYRVSGRSAKARINKIKKNSDLLGELDQGAGARGDLSVLTNYEASREPVMLKFGTREHLNWTRFCDIRSLAEMRGGIHPGSRDVNLFWMATMLAHAGVVTSENLENEIGELVGAFSGADFDPIGDRCMMSLVERLREKEAGRVVHFKGGSYDPLYTPTNDHLIDVLCITSEEQEKLTTIISGEEKLRRADAKVEGRADRRQHRLEWRGLALQMKAEALAAGETRFVTRIAGVVGVDARQVSKLFAGRLDRDPTRVETRGRKKQNRPDAMVDALVKIVVARRGGLSRSIWVSADQASNSAMLKTMAAAAAQQPALMAAAFESEFVSTHVFSFPNRVIRVIFSITRKREEEKEAFARETESRGIQAGGPRANQEAVIQAPTAPTAVQRAPGPASNQAWTGWGALSKVGAARKGITGNRQANQKPIASEGRVTIKRADGTRKSIPILPVAAIMKKERPAYIGKDGTIDFVMMRAEAARIQEERARSKEDARLRDVALDKAECARQVLASVNRLKEIQERAMARQSDNNPSATNSPCATSSEGARSQQPTALRPTTDLTGTRNCHESES